MNASATEGKSGHIHNHYHYELTASNKTSNNWLMYKSHPMQPCNTAHEEEEDITLTLTQHDRESPHLTRSKTASSISSANHRTHRWTVQLLNISISISDIIQLSFETQTYASTICDVSIVFVFAPSQRICIYEHKRTSLEHSAAVCRTKTNMRFFVTLYILDRRARTWTWQQRGVNLTI